MCSHIIYRGIVFFNFAAGSDYVAVTEVLTFPEGSIEGARSCLNISILDDMAFEKTEYFTVDIGNTPGNVQVHIASTSVHIMDDDSKWNIYTV